MDKVKKALTPKENHQHQTWLEIWLPLLIGLVVVAVVMVLLVLAAAHGSSSIAQWSAISLILMILPMLIVCLFSIAFVFFIDYWLIRGNRVLPGYTENIRVKVIAIAEKIQSFFSSIVSFFLKIDTFLTTLKSVFAHSGTKEK